MIETKYNNVYVDGVDIYRKLLDGSYRKLSKWIDSIGYYMVQFKIGDKKYYKRVHRLIAEAMIPNPDNLPQVNHIDGNKLNNNVDNLEWCTNSYNTQEAYDNGLYTSTTHCNVIATSKDDPEVSYSFYSIRECARELGLNRKTITSILKGEKRSNNYPYYFNYA